MQENAFKPESGNQPWNESTSSLADAATESYDVDMRTPNKKYYTPAVTVDIVLFTIDNSTTDSTIATTDSSGSPEASGDRKANGAKKVSAALELNDGLEVLLIKRTNEPFKGQSALPGGFLHHGETTEDTARRILKDKAGVEKVYLEQLYTFDDLKRDPRGPVLSVSYFAIVAKDKVKIQESSLIQDPQFAKVSALPKLAFDHNKIMLYSIERLRSKFEYTNVSYSVLPDLFSLTDLQKIYEAVFGKAIDKRNFRKKFMQLDLLQETDKISHSGRQRPARLYKFKSKKPAALKKFF